MPCLVNLKLNKKFFWWNGSKGENSIGSSDPFQMKREVILYYQGTYILIGTVISSKDLQVILVFINAFLVILKAI